MSALRHPGTDPSLARSLSVLLSRELDDPMDAFLALAGRELGVSRAYLFQFSPDGETMANTHEWCAPGVSPQKPRLQGLATADFPWWVEQLSSGQRIQAATLGELPEEATNERDLLELQGIQAVLVLPLTDSKGRLRGFMGFDEVEGPRGWSTEAVETLSLICDFASRELERQEIVETLGRMQERLMRTESIARVGGWEFEPDSGETWWSKQARTLLSIPPGAPAPTLFDFFQRIHPLDRDEARERILQILDDGVPLRLTCRLAPPTLPDSDGAEYVQIHGEMRTEPDGTRRLVGTLQDLTLLRTLEEELHHSQRAELVGRMAGGVAHDFNRLLSMILTSAEFLLDDAAGSALPRADLEQIREAARQGAQLTEKLLTLSEPEPSGSGPVEVNWIMRSLERLLARILPPSIRLHVQVGADAGAVSMDGGELEEVIMTLALNARDSMEGLTGSIRMETERQELPEGRQLTPGQTLNAGSYTVITVRDEGHGMTPEVQKRIFQPHFTTRENGTHRGLGLSQAFGAIQQAGGGIGVESTPGKGSLFQVFLPVALASGTRARP